MDFEVVKMSSVIKSAHFYENPFKKSSHRHDLHQIIYIKKGSVKFSTPRGILNAAEGNLVFVNHLSEHSISDASMNYQRYVLDIDPRFPSATVPGKIFMLLFSNSLTSDYILDIKNNSGEFENLFENIVTEAANENPLKDEMLDTLFQKCLIMIYRIFPKDFELIDDKNFDIVRKIQRDFELYPENQHTLTELSKKYNMSISSLSHSFKKITGTAVMNYLTLCRIDKAKLLLSDSQMNITEIYEACGFSDGSNFSRLFRQLVGMSPSDYRRR